MHHLAYLNKQKREIGRREMQKRSSFTYEDVKWDKLLCEDLLYIERYKLTTKNKLREKTSSWTRSNRQCIQVSAAQKQDKSQKQGNTVFCRKLGVIPPIMTIIIPSQNWPSTVGVTVIAMYR